MPTPFDITIDLFLLPEAPAPDRLALQAEVERGVVQLWTSMGLPATPVVSMRWSDVPAGMFDFSLWLGGQWTPVPVVYRSQAPAPLGLRILRAIFDQRAHLITDEQLRLLRRQCQGQGKIAPAWSSAPLAIWRDMAILLLQNGFSLNRLSACFEHWNPERSAGQAFERLIENPQTLALTLTVHPDLAKAHTEANPGWESSFSSFYQDIYQELGILLPEVQLETSDKLPYEQFQLYLNDLWMPVLPGLKPGQARYEESPAAGSGSVFMPVSGRYYTATPAADHAGTGPWTCVIEWVYYWVTNCAGWFVNTGIVDARMDVLEETNRALIVMIREHWPTYRICAVLRQLLREHVSIRNLPEILDVLLRIEGPIAVDDTKYRTYFPPVSRVVTISPGAPPAELTDEQLAGQVRANLWFQVSAPFMAGGVLPCLAIDPEILPDFREGFFRDALPAPGSALFNLLQTLYEKINAGAQRPVLLVPGSARYAVYAVLQPYFPGLAVLSDDDIPPFFKPAIQATIHFS